MHFNCRTVKHPSTKNNPWSLDLKCLLLAVLVEQVKNNRTCHSLQWMEKQIRKKAIEFYQNTSSEKHPNGSNNRSGAKKLDKSTLLIHKLTSKTSQLIKKKLLVQRGETVISDSSAVKLPERSSWIAAVGQAKPDKIIGKARPISIWISFCSASLPPLMAIR